ncbi:Tetratricopeptide repeat protein [Roseovarius albus]|uniref:Tetratricopeptide repeat protein n=1 Tax=Roseovarius albus TaxID=1247867 RepID=A0A1X6ZIP0_9RHOB|nr:tetratricopeptide repeat protein [Roseovarius albus]SLN52290.1 Tetratricopeptide repeat protein [Roseovarius albus]
MEHFNLGPYTRDVTTTSAEAQQWFNRGLIWTYGYNHELAIECFQKALEQDPDCAMAHWGVAYASGPNYNFEWWMMDRGTKAKALGRAYDHTHAALALVGNVTAPERALIEALQARYPQREPIKNQSPWNDDFATVMKQVYEAFPDDIEVATIYAESILNQTPWKMWDIHKNAAAEGANPLAAQAVLEKYLDTPQGQSHPGILHLYIHLMEMSPTPEKALMACDHLRELVPDAGHLIHMPTHIDVQCGHYRDVVHWNQKGIEADLRVVEHQGRFNFYTGYRAHNYRFAVYGAMFLGQYEPAITAAEEIIRETPEELLRQESPPMADFMESNISMKTHVQIRFGRWRELIAEPLPEDQALYCYTTAILLYAKGVAHSALGEVAEAEAARERFMEARAKVPDSRHQHNNRCIDLLEVAELMLDGELEYRKENYDVAFAHLRNAIALEDSLPYDEPWGWMQPVRHALGALSLEQGRIEEAEQAYREDLGLAGDLPRACIHPDNIWSLKGLDECLKRRGAGDTAEGKLISQRLKLAAARSDLPVGASCHCAQAAMQATAAE